MPLVVGLRIEAPERVFFLGFDYPGSAELVCAAGNVQGMQPLHRLILIRALQHVRDYIESVRRGVNDRCPDHSQVPREIFVIKATGAQTPYKFCIDRKSTRLNSSHT